MIVLCWATASAALARFFAVGERVEESAPPAALRVLGQTGFGDGHSRRATSAPPDGARPTCCTMTGS